MSQRTSFAVTGQDMSNDTKTDSETPEQIMICHKRVTRVLSDRAYFGQVPYPMPLNQRVSMVPKAHPGAALEAIE